MQLFVALTALGTVAGCGAVKGTNASTSSPTNSSSAAAPSFYPAAGVYNAAQSVAITDANTSAALYYTTDGSTPSAASTAYTGPVNVSASMTLRAIAVANQQNSAVTSGSYTIAANGLTPPSAPPAPTLSPAPGTYNTAQSVAILDAIPSAAIYYTTDGNTPSAASTAYTGPVNISTSMTLRAIAVANQQSSTSISGSYSIATNTSPTLPAPSFSPAPGTYNAAQSVSIADANSSAAIYYTTDGSTPTAASSRYVSPISIASSLKLQAMAIAGQQSSPLASGTYSISLPPAKIAFTTQPTDSTAGGSIAPAVTVAVLDSNGNQVSTASGTISLALQQNGASATLAGSTSSAVSAGAASFSNLIVSTSGSGYTLTASLPGLPTAQSASFTVVPQLPSEKAAQADSFVDSIGVQTHISYVDTAYGNWSGVLTGLKSLGIRHIRDGLPVTSTFVGDFQQLASAGIRCMCGFALPNSLTGAQIGSFVQQMQSAEALEAPNECDAGTNCGGGGLTGIANVLAFLPLLDLTSTATNLPVVGPSYQTQLGYISSGNISSQINFNNLHVYFGGRNPGSSGWGEGDAQGHFYGSFDWWIDQGNLDAPGVPDMVTETGYQAYPSATTAGTIPESVEASYIPRTLLIAYSKGIKKTFIYELLDEWNTTGYGLLASDFTPKPAYTAVKNLIATLQDPGAGFTPGSLHYSISGNTNTLDHLLLQKRDGSYWLVLWLEQSSYDATNNVPLTVTPQNITLSIGAGLRFGNLVQLDPSGNATPTAITSGGYTAPLTISDQVSIVEIQPR